MNCFEFQDQQFNYLFYRKKIENIQECHANYYVNHTPNRVAYFYTICFHFLIILIKSWWDYSNKGNRSKKVRKYEERNEKLFIVCAEQFIPFYLIFIYLFIHLPATTTV